MRTFLLLVLAAVATLVMQRYVGGETIYAPEHAAGRDSVHQILLTNQLPPGRTWRSYGLAGASARAATVYLAEGIHRGTGMSVQRTYWLIDTLALFASIVSLYGLLTLFAAPLLALAGVLFFTLLLPLTYTLHFFHPWDRLSLLSWIAALYCLRTNRLGAFAVVLVAGVLVKYDMVPLPGLYFLAHARRENLKKVTLTTVGLLLLSFGTYAALTYHFGAGVGPRDAIWTQMGRNLAYFGKDLLFYPPLLAFGLPLLLTAIGWRDADRFTRASVAFAGLLAIPLFAVTNFAEVRAEVPLLVLLLPAALAGLRQFLPPTPLPAPARS